MREPKDDGVGCAAIMVVLAIAIAVIVLDHRLDNIERRFCEHALLHADSLAVYQDDDFCLKETPK